ncbi:MAG: PLP-dependent aminotransferase family protein [Clostridia bacterium]|nr:PLP-dependent aminotransferase family protein [Clostridia bacterium]
MKYSVNRQTNQSAYMQLYYQLRDDIINQTYKHGDRLPSKRILAEETGTSVITVEHTYNILCDEGYAEARERSGFFVTYKSEDFTTAHMPLNVKPYLKTSYEHNAEDFPFSTFAKTMRNVISKYGEQILVKSPNSGTHELKHAICSYLSRSKGIDTLPERIVIGSGAEYLYSLIIQLLGRGMLYAIENPSYEKIHSIYLANGAKCDLLNLGNDGIISSELSRTKAQVLHITPYRSFPSGVTASASKRREYINWAISGNRFIIEDDFSSEFTVSSKHEDTVFSLDSRCNVIYVNTFTQTIAPSMRIGYMVLPENLCQTFNEKLGFYSCTVPVFEQYVLAEFINNGDFERHINRVRKKRRKQRKNDSL